jgi:pimeloyl-ACP methyl ester carboxylesterase
MSDKLPLILLSGMGADERIFRFQREQFDNLRLSPWIAPQSGDDLPRYAQRMAEHVNPDGRPCFVGGVSLGGMIAIEMARHLNCRGCFLIASVRSPRELPWRARVMKPAALLLPPGSGGVPPVAAKLALAVAGRFLGPVPKSLLRQLADADRHFLRWASMALLRWKPHQDSLAIPVRQIHGDRDHVLPHSLTAPDRLVPGGGHLLPMTHAEQVNAFLREGMDELRERQPGR